jgi:DNA-directed RNA polymerase subunit RPC12/RpoP
MMTDGTQKQAIQMHHSPRQRYRCQHCQRLFTVDLRVWQTGNVRCPACLGDDVAVWLSWRDHLLRFLMLYEAA